MFLNLIKKIFFIGIVCYAIGFIIMTSSAFAQELTFGQSVYDDNTVINFPDKNLEQAVRDSIDKNSGDILYSDVKNIKELLTGADCSITDIEGIQYFTSLIKLKFSYSNISEITPLSRLSNLESLDLFTNNISDITALKDLTNLKSLCLANNNIRDITALRGLVNLKQLSLGKNNISDLRVLSNLEHLEVLALSQNQINDIAVLSNMKSLNQLNLDENKIEDISALSDLTNLELLGLSYNRIDDISPLRNLILLEHLYLANNPIEDFSPVKSFYYNLYFKDFNLKYTLGDLNGDGKINVGDYTSLRRYLLNILETIPYAEGHELEVADLNGDGKINVMDYTILQRYILGIIKEFPRIEFADEADFDFDAETGTITKCKGSDEDVRIPSAIKGIPVKSIGDYAFRSSNVALYVSAKGP